MVGSDAAKMAKLNAPIKSVVWKNSSLNEFVRKMGTHVGYTVQVVDSSGTPTTRDTMLSLEENNQSILSILNKAAQLNKDMLNITVSHVRQKIIVTYK